MYEDYYGFVEKPFSLTPDPKFLYKSESHAGAFELLQYAIRRREGFAVITGDIGTGKTTLCRALLEQVDRQTFTALVLNPFLSQDDLLQLILQDFGVISPEQIQKGAFANLSKQVLISALYDFLLGLLPIGASAVVIIDEAQNLPLQVLEQIRILSNLETDKEKLLQIVLVGQSALEDLLRSPELRQLDQRISIRYHLQPLSDAETAAYIAHRLTVAGNGSRVTFARDAVRLVHGCSGGLPRVINLICDRALLTAYGARTNRITAEFVQKAAEGLSLPAPPRSWMWSHRRALTAAAVSAALAAAAPFVSGLAMRFNHATQTPAAVARTEARPSGTAASTAVQTDPVLDSVPATPASTPPQLSAATAVRQLPSGPGYTVVVASYPTGVATSQSQVASLTTWLEQSGFAVYYADVDLASRGRWRRVLVGAYADMEQARHIEAQLKHMPGLEQARTVSFQVASTGAASRAKG